MLRTLLEKPAPVDNYVEWMDMIVERRIVKVRKYEIEPAVHESFSLIRWAKLLVSLKALSHGAIFLATCNAILPLEM